MSIVTIVMGDPGTGKSTSIRNLDPSTTFIINVLDKPLPFKGGKGNYSLLSAENPTGNYIQTDDSEKIISMIKAISERRPDIETIIIDDFQYIMANEFMRKAKERGFDKFVDIGVKAWNVINSAIASRDNLVVFVLSHTESDNQGKVKIKTIGKMLDEKVSLEGMVSIILHSIVIDGKHKFLSQNDGQHIARSPIDMFESKLIDNDLLIIKNKIHEYFTEYFQPIQPKLKEQKNEI